MRPLWPLDTRFPSITFFALIAFWSLWAFRASRTLWTHGAYGSIGFLRRFQCRFYGICCIFLTLCFCLFSGCFCCLSFIFLFFSDGFIQHPLIFCCHSVCLAVQHFGNGCLHLFQFAQIACVVPRRVNGDFYKDRCFHRCPPYRPGIVKGSHVDEYSPNFREVLFCHIPKQCDGFLLNTLYQQRRIFCAALVLQIQPECQCRKVNPVCFVPLHDKLSADGLIIPDDKSLFLIGKDHLFSNNRDHNITPFSLHFPLCEIAERFGKQSVFQLPSAVRIYFRRGKQRVSRHLCRWNSCLSLCLLGKGLNVMSL